MAFKDEVSTYIRNSFARVWSVTDGRKVPTPESAIGQGPVAVRIDAAVLYADLTDSTGLVKTAKKEYAAGVYKAFVYAAAKCIRFQGGEVTAYDGDRVMGVFIGDNKEVAAVRAAFYLRGIRESILVPELLKVWKPTATPTHKVGVDASVLWVANTGIRGNTDYVWVGNAANNAAKMSALKLGPKYSTYVTKPVLDKLDAGLLRGKSGSFWTTLATTGLGYTVYGADAWINP
jgi:class 3 adenylate cyclase